jgi:hypothetical protein
MLAPMPDKIKQFLDKLKPDAAARLLSATRLGTHSLSNGCLIAVAAGLVTENWLAGRSYSWCERQLGLPVLGTCGLEFAFDRWAVDEEAAALQAIKSYLLGKEVRERAAISLAVATPASHALACVT